MEHHAKDEDHWNIFDNRAVSKQCRGLSGGGRNGVSLAFPFHPASSLLKKSRGCAGRDCAGGRAATAAMPKRIAKVAQRRPTDARAARPEGCGAFPGGVRWTTADRPPWGMPLSSACSAGKIARNAAHATFSRGC